MGEGTVEAFRVSVKFGGRFLLKRPDVVMDVGLGIDKYLFFIARLKFYKVILENNN
ncbi:hypothetical protein RICGR_1265 [Rickettsiella grylli]|uniref:Uncharacterized protein n=1 Tax=Rickettsiella grylli TaxID=59196 RepID=A8PPC5_9COXI|nr:hypothetical protein RICGR_1265 [Rickettsiella grylli]